MDTNTKYTQDQKRRAVQEIVKRLAEFESTLRLIRQFDICEQDLENYLRPPRMAYDPYTGQPISGWPHVEQRVKSLSGSIFDQAVEEATELRTRAIEAALARYEHGTSRVQSYKDWVTIGELEARDNGAALTRALLEQVTTPSQGMTLGPHPDLKSNTDWT